jgi:hypothetical protein
MSDPLVVAHPFPPGPAVQPQKFSVASMLPVQAVALSEAQNVGYANFATQQAPGSRTIGPRVNKSSHFDI